jgi:hypothetical protein
VISAVALSIVNKYDFQGRKMNTESMIQELRKLSNKYKDYRVDTFATDWSALCSDVANKLEELCKYKCLFLNNFLTKLETIEPRPTEAVVIYYDPDSISLKELQATFEVAQKEFPNNQIIFVSDKMRVELWDKDTLKNQISTLSEILEKL